MQTSNENNSAIIIIPNIQKIMYYNFNLTGSSLKVICWVPHRSSKEIIKKSVEINVN